MLVSVVRSLREEDGYIDGIHPLGSLAGRELSPFVPHFGVFARYVVGNNGEYEEAEE